MAGTPTAVLRTSTLELAPLPGAASCARLHTVSVLHEWGMRALADDAAMIVSELITNAAEASAVLPDRPPVALRLLSGERCLMIEAWDMSPRDPEPRQVSANDENGRGLAVVAGLSARWGCERIGVGQKVVWAEIIWPEQGAVTHSDQA